MRFYLQYDIIVINEDRCWIHLKMSSFVTAQILFKNELTNIYK